MPKPKIIIVGGGFAGCAAACSAVKAGANVTVLERMEVLGGCGLVGGQISNAHFPVREELKLMGGYDIFQVIDNCAIHDSVSSALGVPNSCQMHDVSRIDSELMKHLDSLGVEVLLQSRVKDIKMADKTIQAVVLDNMSEIQADVFIDATGGAGPQANCRKYGNGCVMCVLRCPAFGGRVSIAEKTGIKELIGKKLDGSIGPTSSGCSFIKESIARELVRELERTGCIYVPVPPELVNDEAYKRNENVTSGFVNKLFVENVVLLDNGLYAKRPAHGYTPLEEMRQVPGFERVVYAEPHAGSKGNSIRYMALTPRGDALDVPNVDNLFVASEKLGTVGLPESIVGGTVAGYNAVTKAVGMKPVILPKTMLLGDFLSYVNKRWNMEEHLRERFSFCVGTYFRRSSELGLHTQDQSVLYSRVKDSGLEGIFSKNIVA